MGGFDDGSTVHLDAASRHTPVMLARCVELLEPALAADGAVLVDSTLGMGGREEAWREIDDARASYRI